MDVSGFFAINDTYTGFGIMELNMKINWKMMAERGGIAALVISGTALLASLLGMRGPWGVDASWVAIVLCGLPICAEAAEGLFKRFDIKADVLVALALVASVCAGEYFAAGEVAFIMKLGELLEDFTVDRAKAGIERLVRLTPVTARRLLEDGEELVEASSVRVGDLLRVLPGESVPVDGVAVSGVTSIDESALTGESVPVDKKPGDAVSSGTVNRFGAFDMRAEKVGEDSSMQRLVRLAASADAGKARVVGMADRWATWIVLAALAASAVTWLATGDFMRAVTVLVVFCPCSLVLATPAAVMAGIGNATRRGFLVTRGDAMERLAGVDAICLDKTGTLTTGKPVLADIFAADGIRPDDMLRLASAAEALSEHPLAAAITEGFKSRSPEARLPEARDFLMTPGLGVSATVEGHAVKVGREAIAEDGAHGLPQELSEAARSHRQRGETLAFVALDGRPAGFLALADRPRTDARAALRELEAQGIRPVMLTGDDERTAASVAAELGIGEFHAGCRPEDKLSRIRQFGAEGRRVAMLGDGINDAPALKAAEVGLAMGGIGSDIAVEAADIVLVGDRLGELPHLTALSRRTMGTIRVNLVCSMALNFLAIALAMTGVLTPVTGALVHNAGSLAVVANAALLLRWRRRDR